MVLLMCVKLDGVRWAGSSECTACSTRFDKVFRVCANIAQPPHRGRCVMSITSIVHTSDCVYMHILYMQERTKRIKYTYYISYIASLTFFLSLCVLIAFPLQLHDKDVIGLEPHPHHTLLALLWGGHMQLKLRQTSTTLHM